MIKIFFSVFILFVLSALYSCSPGGILASGGATTMVVAEGDRTLGTVVDDTTIKINIGKDNTDFPSATAITNLEWEDDLQEKQRSIRLLDPSYLSQFIEEFEELMEESAI